MGQIYLVRHGQASFGSQNYDQLSELGTAQATQLGHWWRARELEVSRVVTGKLLRHQQSAKACIAAMQDTPSDAVNTNLWHEDADFNEYNHHEVLARHVPAFDDPAEVKRFLVSTPNSKQAFQNIFHEAIARWMSGLHDADYTESWATFRQRCVAALERQLMHPDHAKNIVIFTSGGTISALCQHVMKFPDSSFAELNWSLVNSAVTRFHVQPAAASGQLPRLALAYLNNFAHLELLNNPKTVTYV